MARPIRACRPRERFPGRGFGLTDRAATRPRPEVAVHRGFTPIPEALLAVVAETGVRGNQGGSGGNADPDPQTIEGNAVPGGWRQAVKPSDYRRGGIFDVALITTLPRRDRGRLARPFRFVGIRRPQGHFLVGAPAFENDGYTRRKEACLGKLHFGFSADVDAPVPDEDGG